MFIIMLKKKKNLFLKKKILFFKKKKFIFKKKNIKILFINILLQKFNSLFFLNLKKIKFFKFKKYFRKIQQNYYLIKKKKLYIARWVVVKIRLRNRKKKKFKLGRKLKNFLISFNLLKHLKKKVKIFNLLKKNRLKILKHKRLFFNFKFNECFKIFKKNLKKQFKFRFRKYIKLLNKFNLKQVKIFYVFKKFLIKNKYFLLFKLKFLLFKNKKKINYLFSVFYNHKNIFFKLNNRCLNKSYVYKNLINKKLKFQKILNFLTYKFNEVDEIILYLKLKYLNVYKKLFYFSEDLLLDYNQNNIIIINKFNYLFFIGLIQIINYNTTFKQYSFEIYTGFKFDFSLLFFKSFFFTKYNFNLFKTFYLFLYKFYKIILNDFKKKLKRFIFLSNIKPKIKIFKKAHFNFLTRFQDLDLKFLHLSNSFINRYVFLFSQLFLFQYKNTFSVFSWRNIKNYNMINNYKIFKYLKLKKMNTNIKIYISFFYNQIKINFYLKNIIYLIKILTNMSNFIYLYILKFLISKFFHKLCHSLIN